MRITKLTIRGFNDEQSILLDGDLVIIYGLNGSGKSSFTEALEWLFFGEISRQRLSRCRSDYQYEEYLKNLFYTGPGNPFVEVQGLLNGKSVKVRKEITAGGEKCFIDDKEVPDFGSINLDLQNYFRPMLAQTEIQALVDTEQKDRWEQLSSILGQDDLTRLRDNLISLKKKKKDENYKKQELKWQSILSDINDIQSLAPFSQPVQLLEGNSLLSEIQRITGRPSVNLKDILEEVKVRQKSLLNTELGRRVTDISYKDTSDLIKYLEELTDNLKKLEEHAKVLALEGHDHNYLEFLQTGLSFVKYPECPFCLERTLTRKRLDIINNTLEQGKGAQEAKSQFTQTKSSINLWVSTFPEKIKLYLPLQQELKIISQKFLDIDEAELAAKVQEVEKNISALIADCARELQLGVDEFFSYLEKKYFHNNRVDEGVHAKLDSIIGKITSQQEDIISKWEDLKIKIAEKLPFTGEGNQEEIKKWFTLEKVISFFIGAEVFIKQTNLLKQADSIQTKLEQYEKNEVSRLLETHASEIKNYYERLNPSDEIQFSGIEVKEGARRQAKLKGEAFGKVVNPVTFFSTAHTNSLALSIYFPQRVDRNDTWEVVILDDPVQSMDDNHSHALIDILVDISAKKQVIVLTHSKAFFRRLCARFGHLRPKIYLFYNNEERGPSISLDEGETLSYLALIEENCKKGDPRSLETAAHLLRKAMEAVCFEFLLDKGVSFSKAQKLQKTGLNSLFAEVEHSGLPAEETGKLKSILDTSHSDSHAWSVANTSQGSIRAGIKYVQGIYDNYLK